MVTIIFRLSDVGEVQLPFERSETLALILQKSSEKAGVELGGVIAVRGGRVITSEDKVERNDVIEVFPALSGG